MSGRRFGTLVTSLSLLSGAYFPISCHAGSTTVKAALGYEFFSQEFFEDSLLQAGADSLAFATTLKTTYLDDIRGTLSVNHWPGTSGRTELFARWEQTPEVFRVRGESRFRPTWGSCSLDASAQVEWKQGYTNDADPTQDYFSGAGRVKLMLPASPRLSFFGQLKSDFITFDSIGGYNFDHYRLGAEAGARHEFADFSSLSVSAFVQSRSVPDSSRLNYNTFGAEASYFGFYSRGDIDLFSRCEARSYDRAGGSDDYLRVEFEGRHRLNLSEHLFSRQEFRLEGLYYSAPGLYSSNYRRLEVAILLGLDGQPVSVALGPAVDWLTETADSATLKQDYVEGGLLAAIDYSQLGRLFGSLESEIGYRNIQRVGDGGTDFVYERLSIMADYEIASSLSFNLLLSAEWEWHDQSSENNSVMLLSTGLQYGF